MPQSDRTPARRQPSEVGILSWITPSWITLISLFAGFLSGVMASLVGVGGAVITTPIIRVAGASPIAAVGSTVPAILPGAISGSLRYRREGYVNWPVALRCGGAGIAFTILGAYVADVVDARYLMVLTALLVGWSGTTLIRNNLATSTGAGPGSEAEAEIAGTQIATPTDRPSPTPSQGGAVLALGALAGFLAGLLGVGGGVVLTPGLVLKVRLGNKEAIATSLVAVAMMSVTSLVTHWALGHIDWRFALPLAIGIVPGARVGAALTVAGSERRSGLIAGGTLTVIAAAYLIRELTGLL